MVNINSYVDRKIVINAKFISSVADPRKMPLLNLPEIVFFGRSNVGKSSLINSLILGKNIARISKTPGRTSFVNIYSAEITNKSSNKVKKFCLVDLPGLGYAKVSKVELERYSKIILDYIKCSVFLNGIFHVYDIRRNIILDDLSLMRKLNLHFKNYSLILSKIDKLPKHKRIPTSKKLLNLLDISDNQLLLCSCIKNIGIYEISKSIWKILN